MATSPVIHQLANRNHDDEETSREGRHNFPEKVEGWQNSREDAFLEAAGLTTNQIQTFAFDYNKMSGFLFPQNTDLKRREKQGIIQPKITEQIDSQLEENIDMNPNMKFGKSENEKMYIEFESKDENYPEDLERRLPNQEADLRIIQEPRKKLKGGRRASKKKSVSEEVLQGGDLIRALAGNLSPFYAQVLSFEYRDDVSSFQVVLSDGVNSSHRCFLTSRTVTRITKNKLVIIRLENFEVKNQTIHINKYFIVSKEQQVIGDPVPIRQFSTLDPTIKPFSSPSSNLLCPYINEIPELHVEKNMDISLTEDHERLIDDFLKFTRDDTVREGTEDKAQLKSNLSALNKVRWDHCYTETGYFSNLDTYIRASEVLNDDGLVLARKGHQDICNISLSHFESQSFFTMEVGAECEL